MNRMIIHACLGVKLNHSSEKGSTCHYITLLSPSHHYSSWSDTLVVQGLVSISHKTSYCKISQSHEAARLVFRFARLLWNLTGTSAILLPKHPSNFKAMWRFKLPISWLRVFTRSYNNASYQILKRDPDRPLFKQSFTPRSKCIYQEVNRTREFSQAPWSFSISRQKF